MRKTVASMLLVSLLLSTNIAHAGTIGFGSSSSNNSGTVGFGSSNPNTNGTIGFGSSSSSSNGGTVGFGTQSTNNGTIGFTSNSSVALFASKSDTSPSSTTLAAGSAYNTVLRVNLTAGSNEGINVTNLTLNKGGSLSDSNISGILVVDADGVRHGNVATFSGGTVQIDMASNPVFVRAGSTHTVSVQVNFSSSTLAPNRTFSVEVPAGGIRATGATTNVARTVEGNFPIASSTFSMAEGSNGTIGFTSSNNTNGTIGFGSSSNNGTIGFGSSNSNGTIGFGSSNSNGTIGFGSTNSNGSVGFGNSNQNGTIGFPSNGNENGVIGFPTNGNQNGVIGFPTNGNQNGVIGFPENTRPTVRLLDARNITNNSATVFFNGYDNENDMLTYEVCLDDAPDTNNSNYTPTFNNCQTTSNEFFRFNNLTANNMYMWTVRVRDSGGLGTTENGPMAFVTLQNAPSNNMPTVTLGSVSNVNNTSATVSWSVSDTDGTSGHQYDICYSASRNNVYTSCRETVTGNSYTVTNLTPGTTYYWSIRVRDGEYSVFPDAGMSSFTTTGTSPVDNRIPSVLLGAATNHTSTSVTLNWAPLYQDAGETYSYVVCYATNYNNLYQGCNISTQGTTVNVTNLTPNTTYFWDVRVADGTYFDQFSLNGPLSFRTSPSTDTNNSPTATLIAPATGTTVNNTTVNLQWSATDVDAGDQANLIYELYAMSVSAGATAPTQNQIIQSANRVTLSSNSATSYTYTTTNNTDVYWAVQVSDQRNPAYFPAQNGPFHFFVRLNTTGNNAPDFVNNSFAPTDNQTFTNTNPVTLTWSATDADGDALTYALYVVNQDRSATAPTLATVMNSANRISLASNNTTSYSLNVSNDRAYYWVVTVTDNRIANPIIAFAEPRLFTVNTNATGNMSPVITLVSPVDQSTQQNQADYNLTWSVADDNAANVRYTVYARQVSLTTTLQPSELVQDQYIVATNLSTLTHNYQVASGSRLYWTVRATDGAFDPLANNGPFYFDTQVISGNNTAPVVTLVSPINGVTVAPNTSYRLAWSVQDNAPANVRYEVFAREVNASTTLTRTDVEQSQYRIATDLTNTYFDVIVGNGNRLYWSVRALDGAFTPYATNAPFMFTVAPTTVNNLSTELAILNNAGNTQTTFNSPDTSTVRLRLRNTGSIAQTISFPTTREFDVVVTNTATGQIVRQASNGTTTTNTPTTRTLGAGATQEYTFAWDMRDNAGNLLPTGTYRVDAYLLSDSPLISVAPVTITVNGTTGTIAGITTDLIVSNSTGSNSQTTNIGQNDPIVMKVVANNTTNAPITLTFNGRATRITATNVSQNQVYFNSDLATPTTTIPTTIVVPANGSYTLETYVWNGVHQNGGSRVSGNYTIAAVINATVGTITVPSRTITLQTASTGGGGGGGSYTGGGNGGGGINVDTTTMLQLPTVGSDTELVWYGPINFAPSNGQINRPLRHVEYVSGVSASWDRGTIVTDKAGNRFLGTYYVPSRYLIDRLQEPMKGNLPTGISYLDGYFIQYGNLAEKYSKPVTIRASLPKAPSELMGDTSKLAILGWDFETGKWVKMGDISNFDGRFYEVDTMKSTILTVVDTSNTGTVIPGGPNVPGIDNGYGADTCLNTSIARTPFPDANSHWGAYYICRLYKMGAVSGYLDGPLEGMFNPEGSVTRAEILTSVMKLYGYDVAGARTDNLFPDVQADEWYTAYISQARDLGIIAGYPDGYFRPHYPVNRAEAMKIVLLAAKNIDRQEIIDAGTAEREDFDSIAGFMDVPESAWYSSYVSYARSAAIIGGKSDGNFAAGDYMTRAEMAKVLFLAYTKPKAS